MGSIDHGFGVGADRAQPIHGSQAGNRGQVASGELHARYATQCSAIPVGGVGSQSDLVGGCRLALEVDFNVGIVV